MMMVMMMVMMMKMAKKMVRMRMRMRMNEESDCSQPASLRPQDESESDVTSSRRTSTYFFLPGLSLALSL